MRTADLGPAISPHICVGLKVSEMMALGKTFVTIGKWHKGYSNLSYIVHRRDCVFAPLEPRSIAHAIAEILCDSELRTRLWKDAASIRKKCTETHVS